MKNPINVVTAPCLSPDSAKLFQLHFELILGKAYGVALRLTRNSADAEDLVQEAALKSFSGFHTFQVDTNFNAWFLRIMTNTFFTRCRKKQVKVELIDLQDDALLERYKAREASRHNADNDVATCLNCKKCIENIAAAMAELPLEYRVVAALYFMDELSYQEIADVTSCPVGTVRSRLHRSRIILQKSLWRVAKEHGIFARLA